jgi:hypothetical protein
MSLHPDVALQFEEDTRELEHVVAALLDDPDFKKLFLKKQRKAEAMQKRKEQAQADAHTSGTDAGGKQEGIVPL